MKLYCAIDLHSNNHFLTIIDEEDRRLIEKRLPNDLAVTLKMLAPYQQAITAIAVESTFNWYWLVDGLQEAGYAVMLVNTSKVHQYEGLKHTDDQHDAFWLAHLMRLGILPTGYIYPKQERALRDLLRERRRLVAHRTTHLHSVMSTFWRHTAVHIPANIILGKRDGEWPALDSAHTRLGIHAHRMSIAVLNRQIDAIEKRIHRELKPNAAYQALLSVRGIGPILAWTILLESGDLKRFENVGHFSSYCRCVNSERFSNGKKKGEANAKNGNRYLAWAFFEAAHFAIRFMPEAKRFYEKKARERNPILAMKALAHKLARACFYLMRDLVPFEPARLFA